MEYYYSGTESRWCGNWNHLVCHRSKCEVDHPSQSTVVNLGRKQKWCSLWCPWSQVQQDTSGPDNFRILGCLWTIHHRCTCKWDLTEMLNVSFPLRNRTTSELDLCILVTHYWNFSESEGHNSAENNSTRPKVKLNLRILLSHLYTEFQFKMSICNGDNQRKLKINGIFLSPRGITLPKIIRPDANSNLTCVFFRHIYLPNFNSKCQFVMEIMSGNWKLMEFF